MVHYLHQPARFCLSGAGSRLECRDPCTFCIMKKKTIVYIDGFNLYYGLLKGTKCKWLDLAKFARNLLSAEHEIVSVKYFTACTLTYPHDSAAVERQNIYLQALLTLPDVKVVKGFFKKNKVLMPAAEEGCRNCGVPQNGLVRVVKLEEKRSDVNMAVEMMVDAAKSDVECLVLVSGDADQVGTIEAARWRFGKKVLVFNPQSRVSDHLKKSATYYRNIPRELPSKCQLPESIPVGTHGNRIYRPVAWA